MTLMEAIERCHVRSAVYRESKPSVRYYKNHPEKIISRVPPEDQLADDWQEYDPRDDDTCSLFMFND
jgi:hypothetical protein